MQTFLRTQQPVLYISTDLLTSQINVFSINLIMTESSVSECLETPVIAGLRSLPRVQSIAEPSNYALSTQAKHADPDNSSIFEDLQSIQEKNGSNILILDC